MASTEHLSFPASRSCLWDSTPTGGAVQVHAAASGWPCLRVSSAAVQLAVRHSKQTPGKKYECFLIGTSWITERDTVAVEVDRFDPGRVCGREGGGVVPTTLIPGDIAIPCQVVCGGPCDAQYLTHNLQSLQTAFTELNKTVAQATTFDPTVFHSLRMHCTSTDGSSARIQCSCVCPALSFSATPIRPLAVVQTALARNLVGPLPLSLLQGRVKHGFLTMELSRKLVLLLHSDPKASTLPLVGIWISGVSSVHHPLVWSISLSYCLSSSPRDRVRGEGGAFILLLYLEGKSEPTFWQCLEKEERGGVGFEMSNGEAKFEFSSERSTATLELLPVMESSALHTLLHAASHRHTLTPHHHPSTPLHPSHPHTDTCDSPLPLSTPHTITDAPAEHRV